MANLNAAFWRWFGNSVVRNEDGTPKVVYHWTPHNFSVFDKDRIGTTTDMGDAGAGFYFYANAQHTRFYGSRLISAYLKIERPLVVPEGYLNTHERLGGTAADKKVADEFLAHILDIMLRLDPSFKPSRYRPAGLYHLVKHYGEHRFTEAVIAAGYDGIVYRDEYIVYESNQIKSIGNDGTWDLGDPDIYSNPALEDRGPEFFDFAVAGFDVQKAKQILIRSPREPVFLKMDNVKQWLALMRVDPAKAMSDDVDPTMPVIGATIKFGKQKGVLPIDGWHRIYKAHKLGLEGVPMFLLTDKESKKVRIR